MYTEIKNMPGESRLWIYQANRKLSGKEIEHLTESTREFTNQWTAHDRTLRASFDVAYGCFFLLAVDESLAGASGCSIDTSVRFIHKMEQELNVSFFDRLLIPFLIDDEVVFIKMNEIEASIYEGRIQEDTLTFDNVITRLGDIQDKWKVEAGKSWLSRYFKKAEKIS